MTKSVVPNNLATDMRDANLEANQWRRYFPPEVNESRQPFNLWAFAVIFIAVVVIVESVRAF